MKFSINQPLSWTDGSGRRHMAVLSTESRGLIRCESTTMGTEILPRAEAEAFVQMVQDHHGGQFLKPKRKPSAKRCVEAIRYGHQLMSWAKSPRMV